MCCGDDGLVFGGDLQHPKLHGHNQYRLWTRSACYEGVYCLILLYSMGIAVLIYVEKAALNICYEASLVYVILAHILKPFLIAFLMKCIPSSPMCCDILRLSPMAFMDVPYAIFVMIFSYFPLLRCVLSNQVEIDTLMLVILLSCLVIHFIFPLMAVLRLIEVIVFEYKLKRFRARRAEQRPVADNNVREEEREQIEIAHLAQHGSDINESNGDAQEFADEDRDEFDETVDNVFVYGNARMNEEQKTSLSNFFAASTRFISSGVINKMDEEDICIICYDIYEKGKLCAKLKCGHIFHRECVKEWLQESVTCPLCRIGVEK